MTATLYPLYKSDILKATTTNLDLDQTTTNGPYAVLATAAFTYSAAHQFFSSVTSVVGPANGVIIGAQTFTVSGNLVVFDGADCVFTAVASGAAAADIIIYRQNAGATSTWSLVSFYDTAGGGLPVTPNGGDITIQWNASGIFSLSDARFKHDIRRIEETGRIGLYEYRYRVPDAPLRVGFIAQEVEAVAPWAVVNFAGRKYVNYAAALEAM